MSVANLCYVQKCHNITVIIVSIERVAFRLVLLEINIFRF